MTDSGNMTEAQEEVIQPDEVVATETEEGTEPQGADTDEHDTSAEVEADQQDKPANGAPDFKAAMKAERAKKKAEREAKEKAEREVAELREQLALQGKLIAEVRAGAKPKADDFYGDPEGYVAAIAEWEKKLSEVPEHKKPEQQQQSKPFVLDEDVEEYQISSIATVKAVIPDYDALEDALSDQFKAMGRDPELAFGQLADLAYGEELDYGRIVAGLGKFPEMLDKVLSAQTPGVLKRRLKEAQAKVELPARKKMETKPEPSVQSGGNGKHGSLVEKAYNEWKANPSLANHSKYVAAKKAAESRQ